MQEKKERNKAPYHGLTHFAVTSFLRALILWRQQKRTDGYTDFIVIIINNHYRFHHRHQRGHFHNQIHHYHHQRGRQYNQRRTVTKSWMHCLENESSVAISCYIILSDGVMRTPKRCLRYDSTRNFHHQIFEWLLKITKFLSKHG